MRFIKPESLNTNSFILDVRTIEEYQRSALKAEHKHIALADLKPIEFIKDNALTGDCTVNILCASGNRASQAAEMFEKVGFDNVAVIIGGIVEAEYEGLEIVRH
ncbi:MAG: rhodanese-like domain-containing protein [Alphaproteobacteria bacterium]|nr:rhodanese-like domain-containing protein [Alphaproteobacteria bacterium]